MSDETVRIYTRCDSGPYCDWSDLPGDREPTPDGFGDVNPVIEVPAETWRRYLDAQEVVRVIEGEFEQLEAQAQ